MMIEFLYCMSGGYPRLPGMERKDLTAKNAEGMRDQAKALELFADRDIKVLIVANPANTNTLVAMKSAPSIPQKNFTCLTRLDHERLRGFIAEKINSVIQDERISAKDIKNVAIFGNHSTTQVPFFSAGTVSIAGEVKKVSSFFDAEETLELIRRVQNRGGEVIKAQQASSALSAANAIGRHLKDWIIPEINDDIFSMGILSDGNMYGVPDGLVYSFPCHHTENGIQIASNFAIDNDTKEMLDLSVKELQEEKVDAESMVGSLLLIPSSKL
jgi:malate dehydrogenase